MLVLSACQTAISNSEAPLGISGSALKTGTNNVLATLWDVNDAEAESFIRDFYSQLREGKTVPVALQKAALKRIAIGDHPKFWSAFVNYSNLK